VALWLEIHGDDRGRDAVDEVDAGFEAVTVHDSRFADQPEPSRRSSRPRRLVHVALGQPGRLAHTPAGATELGRDLGAIGRAITVARGQQRSPPGTQKRAI
jgi:hypothetical protein